MKNYLITAACASMLMWAGVVGCGSPKEKANVNANASVETPPAEQPKTENKGGAYDPNIGAGKFNDENVKIGEKLDATMATGGKKIYDVKCGSCHKLTDERLVGPGWKDVTKRRKAPWVMNFVTNVDEMLDKDPAAQAQLEVCLVRMPNQSLSDADARNVYEFMRQNDGVK